MRKKSSFALTLVFAGFCMLFSFWQALSPAHAAGSNGVAAPQASSNPYED